MSSSIETIQEGSVTSPSDFYAAGVACGIKANNVLDLALVYSTGPCVSAAMFTTNLFKAAPVLYDQRILEQNPAACVPWSSTVAAPTPAPAPPVFRMPRIRRQRPRPPWALPLRM